MKSDKPVSKLKVPLVKSTISFPVVGIGASAGGLDAFKKLLKAIPENTGSAFVLVQHLSPSHESLLPEILQKVTSMPVVEIAEVVKVEPNFIYIIPSNKLLVANDGVLQLIPRTEKDKNRLNLPIDLFFTSLAEVHQNNAIGVILSGTGSDGTQGLKAIKENGGITFAQDEESAAFDGMPLSAVLAGVVDFILPPDKIPQKLLEIISITNGKNVDEQNIAQKDEEAFRHILSVLRIRKGTDFTYYKQTTIRRRILRRMAFNKIEEPAAYLQFLRESKTEQDHLYQDLLIPVTSFFRDMKSFENLCESVFPRIIKSKQNGEPIRVWVAGCSTGEEAYSIAICLREFLDSRAEKVQIFATDLSEPAIAQARLGIFTKLQVEEISPQRQQEFFTRINGSYQVKKNIRDMCVFAVHNFLKDPPFGKLDLISCRNVLIYMEPYLQKKALTTFHYALNADSYLLLGKSETISSVSGLFSSAFKNDKLFSRKDLPGKFMVMATPSSEQNFRDININPKMEHIRTDFQKTADDIMLSKYTPASVVVNEAMDIVHFRGSTANYLEQAPGKPSHNILKMARQGLSFELRNILHKAKKEKTTVIKENIPLQINGSHQKIAIEAIPLPNVVEPYYLVLFHDNQPAKPRISIAGASSKLKKDEKDLRIEQLEKELAQSREDMRSITEEQEAANEELQSANEELLSGSEELQSLNEELETGKEELQSTNEELTVVNNELVSLNEQLTLERNFSSAIIDTLHEPLIVLDHKLRIKTCNQAFYKTFLMNEMETEGKLIYELGKGQWNAPELRMMLEKVLPEKLKITQFEVVHRFPNLGERIMLLNGQEIIKEINAERLILLAIEDVTEMKQAQEKMREKNIELERMNTELESFSYVASHDLQEPLRKIQTFAMRVLEKEHEKLSDNGKEYFRRMQNAAKRMQALIEDLLSFSRVNNTEKNFDNVDLLKIIEDVKKDFREEIEEKNATIEVLKTCTVRAIPFQLHQLIQNLIGNSLKFQSSGKKPYISISSSLVRGNSSINKKLQSGKDYCHIVISDNGIGFEAEFNEKIFEIFQRLHRKEEYAGTGIGLAIVKKIVENHNGVITVQSELGKGSRFDIYIPAS